MIHLAIKILHWQSRNLPNRTLWLRLPSQMMRSVPEKLTETSRHSSRPPKTESSRFSALSFWCCFRVCHWFSAGQTNFEYCKNYEKRLKLTLHKINDRNTKTHTHTHAQCHNYEIEKPDHCRCLKDKIRSGDGNLDRHFAKVAGLIEQTKS
jgi:hypothetical protein